MTDVTPEAATPGQAVLHDGATLHPGYDRLAAENASLREQLLRTEEKCRRHVNQADAGAARYKAERDAAREELGVACDSLENTAAGMDLSAMTSHPSKKSEIERGCAHAIRAIARTARAALGEATP